jgi:hypothetical protein
MTSQTDRSRRLLAGRRPTDASPEGDQGPIPGPAGATRAQPRASTLTTSPSAGWFLHCSLRLRRVVTSGTSARREQSENQDPLRTLSPRPPDSDFRASTVPHANLRTRLVHLFSAWVTTSVQPPKSLERVTLVKGREGGAMSAGEWLVAVMTTTVRLAGSGGLVMAVVAGPSGRTADARREMMTR